METTYRIVVNFFGESPAIDELLETVYYELDNNSHIARVYRSDGIMEAMSDVKDHPEVQGLKKDLEIEWLDFLKKEYGDTMTSDEWIDFATDCSVDIGVSYEDYVKYDRFEEEY